MTKLEVLLATNRPPVHQARAVALAPEGTRVTVVSPPTREALLDAIGGYDVLVTERLGDIDADIIGKGARLRLIQRFGRMTHDIDVEAARAAGIPVCNWPLPGCVMVAEHVVMQILSLARRVREGEDTLKRPPATELEPRLCDANYFAINWTRRENIVPLFSATVGIMGFGEIGSELATRLRAFGCDVLYNKRNRLPEEVEAQFGVRYADLDTIRAESDFLCLLLPHMGLENGFVDASFLAGMKRGAFLVSSGASSTLNEADVARAYLDGRLAGVATDGWNWEPLLPDNPLLALANDPAANVMFTPHTAGGSIRDEDIRANQRRVWQNVANLIAGKPLANRVA
jgi:lactate dehydrogenase-like 2-hydroxyacid dehydrogenase